MLLGMARSRGHWFSFLRRLPVRVLRAFGPSSHRLQRSIARLNLNPGWRHWLILLMVRRWFPPQVTRAKRALVPGNVLGASHYPRPNSLLLRRPCQVRFVKSSSPILRPLGCGATSRITLGTSSRFFGSASSAIRPYGGLRTFGAR